MPNKSSVLKSDKFAGNKLAKQQVTILCNNMNGEKESLIVIERGCFKEHI